METLYNDFTYKTELKDFHPADFEGIDDMKWEENKYANAVRQDEDGDFTVYQLDYELTNGEWKPWNRTPTMSFTTFEEAKNWADNN